jgi:hypothetical protein
MRSSADPSNRVPAGEVYLTTQNAPILAGYQAMSRLRLRLDFLYQLSKGMSLGRQVQKDSVGSCDRRTDAGRSCHIVGDSTCIVLPYLVLCHTVTVSVYFTKRKV